MAVLDLRVDYKDDILDSSVNAKRKYNIIENEDGTKSLEDVSVYTQNGDSFGAADINKTNQAVLDLNSSLNEAKSSLTNILTPKLIKLAVTTEADSSVFGGYYSFFNISDSVLENNGINKNTVVAITPIGAVGDNGYSAIISPYSSNDTILKGNAWVLNSSKAMTYTVSFIAWCKES